MTLLERCKTPEEMTEVILGVLRKEDKYHDYQGFVHTFPQATDAKKQMVHRQCLALEQITGMIRRRNESSDHVTWELNNSGDDGMFERFTDRARRVMQLANSEANKEHYDNVEPLHILVALLEEKGGIASVILTDRMQIDRTELIKKARKRISQFRPKLSNEEIASGIERNPRLNLDPAAKNIVREAIEGAKNLGHNYVGTEHLLISMAHQDWHHGILYRILTASGVSPHGLIAEVNALLNGDKIQEEKSVAHAIQEAAPDIMQFIPDHVRAKAEAEQFENALAGRIFQVERAIHDNQTKASEIGLRMVGLKEAEYKLEVESARLREYLAALLKVKAGDETTAAPDDASLAA